MKPAERVEVAVAPCAALIACVSLGCGATVAGGRATPDASPDADVAAGRDDVAPPEDRAPVGFDVAPDVGAAPVALDDGMGCVLRSHDPSPLCAGAADCPVRLDAELRCAEGADGLSVAAGAGAAGYLSFGFTTGGRHHRLYTIDPGGGSRAEARPLGLDIERVATTPAGEPRLFGMAFGTRTSGVYYGAPAPGGWRREAVALNDGSDAAWLLDDAALGPDGAAYALHHADRGPLTLSRRDGDGRWSPQVVASDNLGPGLLASGSSGAPPAVYWARRGLNLDLTVAAPGAPPARVATSRAPDVLVQHLDAVVPSGGPVPGAPVVSVVLEGALRVFVPSGAGAWRGLPAPMPGPTPPGDCPPETAPPDACEPALRCTERSGASVTAGLGATVDGDVWLVQLWRHVDRDLRLTRRCGVGMPCLCERAVVEDRTAHQILIARVPLDGADVRFTRSLTLAPPTTHAGAELHVEGREGRLVLAFRTTPAPGGGVTAAVRYVDLDARRLR